MKIGILTYHRSHNYGALLQAIALRKVLQGMGHIVTYIDYWPEYHQHMYAIFNPVAFKSMGIRGKYGYLKTMVKTWKYRKERIKNFNAFIAEYIEPYVSSVSEDYDLIIHGSDQIWRKQPEMNTYNPIYFGKHKILTKKRITYAASMGILPDSNTDKDILKTYLSELNKISVRETDLKTLVEHLGYTCEQHLDPTLLLKGEEWVSLMNIPRKSERKYVLFYHLLDNSFDVNEIEAFARERKMEMVTIYSWAKKKENIHEITTANPLQFLELIYNAEFVFTSSFHGLVFSLLFEKQFLAAFSTNAGRAMSILSQLELSNRLLHPMSRVPSTLDYIDYPIVSKRMDSQRMGSLRYLKEI